MEPHFRSGFWLFAAVALFLCLSGQTRTPKNVQVALGAKWSGAPLLLEAGYAISTILIPQS